MKSKYYPWFFFVMFSLIFAIMWDLLIGICIGYLRKLYTDVYNLAKWMVISKTFAERLENSVIFAWLNSVGKFVSVNEAADEDLSFTFSQNGTTGFQMGNMNLQPPAQERPPIVPFSGTGYKLGGDTANKTKRIKAYVKFQDEEEEKEIEEL